MVRASPRPLVRQEGLQHFRARLKEVRNLPRSCSFWARFFGACPFSDWWGISRTFHVPEIPEPSAFLGFRNLPWSGGNGCSISELDSKRSGTFRVPAAIGLASFGAFTFSDWWGIFRTFHVSEIPEPSTFLRSRNLPRSWVSRTFHAQGATPKTFCVSHARDKFQRGGRQH